MTGRVPRVELRGRGRKGTVRGGRISPQPAQALPTPSGGVLPLCRCAIYPYPHAPHAAPIPASAGAELAHATNSPEVHSARRRKRDGSPGASSAVGAMADAVGTFIPPEASRPATRAAASTSATQPVDNLIEFATAELSSAAASLGHWTTRIDRLGFLNTVQFCLDDVSDAVKSTELGMNQGHIGDVDAHFLGLIQGPPALGPVGAFVARVDVIRLDKRKATKVLKMVNQYSDAAVLNEDLNRAFVQVGVDPGPSISVYEVLNLLYRSDKVLGILRDLFQARIAKVAKLPENVLEAIHLADEVKRVSTQYVCMDDARISSLRKELTELQAERSKREDEVRPLKDGVAAFHRERSGALTDNERERAAAKYASTSAVSDKLTLDGYYQFLSQKKAAAFIASRLSSFRPNVIRTQLEQFRCAVEAARELRRRGAADADGRPGTDIDVDTLEKEVDIELDDDILEEAV